MQLSVLKRILRTKVLSYSGRDCVKFDLVHTPQTIVEKKYSYTGKKYSFTYSRVCTVVNVYDERHHKET